MPARSTAQHGRRFPPVIIRDAVWLYLRFPLSYRDVEELLAEHGIEVSYESIRRWVAHFGPHYAAELRKRERGMGWFRGPISAQRFLSAFTRVCNLFRARRHLLSASEYRTILQDRFGTWWEITTFATA